MKTAILVYGAGGYTGTLLRAVAEKIGLPLILASRSRPVDSRFPVRIFSLDSEPVIGAHLHDVLVVVNLAGPFDATGTALIKACIRTKTHYIDIAGEYPEFISAFAFHHQAAETGIMLMPGAGFGVVPTDIAAALAKKLLPDATKLIIGYATEGGASRGTLKTVLKDINKPGIRIKNGHHEIALPADRTIHRTCGGKQYDLVSNPWRADLMTALISTQIPDVETYSAFPGFIVNFMKGKSLWLRAAMLKWIVGMMPIGPTAKQLQAGKTIVWARVRNASGVEANVTIEGPEAYVFTIETLVRIVQRIQAGSFTAGFQTPSIYGRELIEGIEKVRITEE